jgi:hypothetical protein
VRSIAERLTEAGVKYDMPIALEFHINLDPNSPAYRQLGMAVLRADVRANEALGRRYRGEPIDTPPIAHLEPAT